MQQLTIEHDGKLDIATGKSRKELNWRNKEITWSELVKRVSVTHRTAETYGEYLGAKKARQDEIKDIGGFVGGYLSKGRRKAGNVQHRQLITLDLDFATADFWNDFQLTYINAACLYSTHKHSSDSPRLRLIMPLDREVFADEYEAIARKIASTLGIESFDHTTFEPSRLMYWPSTSKDGEFVFEFQDGEWLSADEVLASYVDWKDSSEWPVSASVHNLVQRTIQKQGDPLEKPGVVGAFCRAFSISEAIETFLTDVYESCDVENRYTYKEGSTSAGLVVYDDKYAYSHHGTDPCANKLSNAFDLVRLHKFGLKDEDAKEGTPGNKLPSYTSMVAFATQDIKVKKQIGSERLADAKDEFKIGFDEEPENNDWIAELEVNTKGDYFSTIDNILLILTKDPNLKKAFGFNVFEQREVALKDLPWRKVTTNSKYLTDKDDAGLRHYLESVYGITGVQKIQDGFDLVMMDNCFHPVKDYLEGLYWDEQERVETLLTDYLGVADSEYVRAVTRKTLAAAVARIYRPGCKFDYVLTFVGKQGLKKSSLIDKLGGPWFSDSFFTVQGKEAFEQLQGSWLIEIAELSALKRAEIEAVKHFITKREDKYRVAYGRKIENFPRQCVFFATTNKIDFLKDSTGNRRFWPVDVHTQLPEKDVFKDLNVHEVSQIWAEAVEIYKAGEQLYLDEQMEKLAFEEQAEHTEKDDRMGMIQKYLNTKVPFNWEDLSVFDRRSFLQGDEMIGKPEKLRDKICVAEIWCELFGGTVKDMNSFNTKDLHTMMQNIEDWTKSKGNLRFGIYGEQKGYVREKTLKLSANADFS